DFRKPKWAKSYLFLSLRDRASEDRSHVLHCIAQSVAFIAEHLEEGVLVHCGMGVSRSGMAAVAHVMSTLSLDPLSALSMVQSRRQCILPNEGFMSALTEYYETTLNHTVKGEGGHGEAETG
ncbi:dual specificity phosphatase, partial [Kipferlia bialata]